MSKEEKVTEGKVVFASGAARSKMDVRWDLLSQEFLREMAVVMEEGAAKFGADNWKGGVADGVTENHLLEHYFKWQDGDRSENHLAKVAINAMFLHWYEQHGVHAK